METTTIRIEIQPGLERSDLDALAHDLTGVEDVEATVLPAKDIIAVTLLAIAIVGGVMKAAKSIQTSAKILHGFLHPDDAEKAKKIGQIVVVDGTKQIVINNLSVDEIARVLTAAQQKADTQE